MMIKQRLAYIGDAWCRIGNTLNFEKTAIAMKSIFHPDMVTIHDVEYAIFNKKMKVVSEDDDFATQQDFIPAPDFRDASNDRVKYKWVVPSEDPAGNLPTNVIWTGAAGQEYDIDQLLELVGQMRLGRAADLYGSTTASVTPVQPAQGTDLGDNGDEALEDDCEEEEQGGTGGTSTRDPVVWT